VNLAKNNLFDADAVFQVSHNPSVQLYSFIHHLFFEGFESISQSTIIEFVGELFKWDAQRTCWQPAKP
jgi:hypothetical protein